ncbi:eukaryotic polypeptide chain release factor 3 [Amylocystis lapponica]|nr:eukaryotic polypeptide chain release factor 3 [Amylocystis lapponica]
MAARVFCCVPLSVSHLSSLPSPSASSVERPPLAEAPPPAPTITLNIGGAKPPPAPSSTAPPPSAGPTPAAKAAAAAPTSVKTSASPAPPTSKTFSLEKAKTDTAAIAQEVQNAADEQVITDLYGEAKEHLNIVFIGHVDAGKSTMGGQLLFLSGMVDKRTMEKYEREAKEAGRDSWYLSWALDSTPQERAKGKTVEVGRAYFETNMRRYTILDAPGHKTYVPSMISGAAQADVAILTAGVSKVICVINKMDESTVLWEKSRYDEIVNKMTPFIKAAGFNVKTDLVFIPVSAYTGLNIKDRWPSLLEQLDTMPMVDRKIHAPLMMPVSEKYKDMGTIVDQVEISAIYNEMEDEVTSAMCGDNPVHAVRQFEAQLAILDHKNIICAGYSAVMHIHTLAEEVTLAALLHYFDKATGRKSRKPPQFAKKGQKVVALIETTAAVCVERFVDYPQLGRFTLRDEGKTIAIGKITRLIEGIPEEVVDGVGNLSVA